MMNARSIPDFIASLNNVPAMLNNWLVKLNNLLDARLWKSGIHNAEIRMVMRVQFLGAMAFFLIGIFLFILSDWIFWFSTGFIIHAANFFLLAQQLLRMNINAYSRSMLGVLLLSSGVRLFITAIVLYFVLIVCSAPVSAVACGLVMAVLLALGTYAKAYFGKA